MRTDSQKGDAANKQDVARMGVAAVVVSLLAGGLVALAPMGAAASPQTEMAPAAIMGAWEAQSYLLSTGEEHAIAGKIFFTATDWQVVFFVLDADGTPKRGSAEGGTYATEGESLTFMHRFNLSIGEALSGLPADDLRMVVHESMTTEAARFGIDHDTLTLFFPSGNEMRFRRTS